jgi:hypothetical protein
MEAAKAAPRTGAKQDSEAKKGLSVVDLLKKRTIEQNEFLFAD